MINLYAVFHLNLAFSSISEEERCTVIDRCYWPLLHLLKRTRIPAGIEISGYTLEVIEALEPDWIEALRQWIAEGGELIGCGDTQLIGPLVPWRVNRKNLELGLATYQRLLAGRPRLAFVNEQAYSAGVAECIREAGFEGLMMEWDNPAMLHPEWSEFPKLSPVKAYTNAGATIPVLWNHTISFQKFQRLAHGELVVEDYLTYLEQQQALGVRYFPVYGNDVEIFGFRPGRYKQEAPNLGEQEWRRIEDLILALEDAPECRWMKPSEALDDALAKRGLPRVRLETQVQPVPVKKQKKYNLSRWAVSGRDDLWLNTACHRLYQALASSENNDDWRRLCRLWASDYRTHITQSRFEAGLSRLEDLARRVGADLHCSQSEQQAWTSPPRIEGQVGAFNLTFDSQRHRLAVTGPRSSMVFNAYRGLTVERLQFSGHSMPVIGTLPHGHFDNIELGADFYSFQVIGELYRDLDRITDLEPVDWGIEEGDGHIQVVGRVPTRHGALLKRYTLHESGEIDFCVEFPHWQRPFGSLRVANLTLLESEETALVACHNGGKHLEMFSLDGDFDQGMPASTLVSAHSGLGATEGQLIYGYPSALIEVRWDPANAAAMPLVTNRRSGNQYLRHIFFSLVEQDDTLREGGRLLSVEINIRPAAEELRQQLKEALASEGSGVYV